MELFSVSALISILILGLVLYVVFMIVQWGVSTFGLPALVTKIAGIILGLVFLIRVLELIGVAV